jgi:Ni2+-binding GTPase involved in maturation of urease and hydrogenase
MIRKGNFVAMRYVLRNSKGEVLEDKHTIYRHGASTISPLLQAQLEGLEAGDSRQITLKKGEEGADDDFYFEVVIDSIRETPFPLKIHLLSGFLGSGKTTAILQACRLLKDKKIPVAVITNDQGARLVDGDLFTHLGIPSGQVTNGCFCCNYNDLDQTIHRLSGQRQNGNIHNSPAVLFAESVGSCTDLIATVLKPLLQQHPEWQPTVSVFADARLLQSLLDDSTAPAFDASVRYIYFKQLEEAQVIVVNKADLLTDKATLRGLMQERYSEKNILYQNSFEQEDIAHWLSTLDNTPFTSTLPSLTIDYDLYGAGEAKLAWLDHELEIQCPSNKAQAAAMALMERLSTVDYPIGHLKFLLDGKTKLSFTATGATDDHQPEPAPSANLLINARVQTEPASLSDLVANAITAIENEYDCSIRTVSNRCFQPGFPKPTHRIS